MIKIYHNKRCSKSRQTLSLLESKTDDFEIVDYLKNPPSFEEIQAILVQLNMKPHDLIRKGEAIFKDNYKDKNLTDEELIKAMVLNPILIERPIVIKDNKAILGRPPESLDQLF